MLVLCQDARSYRVQFGASGQAEEWTRRLLDEVSPPVKLEDIFAFAHFAWAAEGGHEELGEVRLRQERPHSCLPRLAGPSRGTVRTSPGSVASWPG